MFVGGIAQSRENFKMGSNLVRVAVASRQIEKARLSNVSICHSLLGSEGNSLLFGGWRCVGAAAATLYSPFSTLNILAGL